LIIAGFVKASGCAGKPVFRVPKDTSKDLLHGYFSGSEYFLLAQEA